MTVRIPTLINGDSVLFPEKCTVQAELNGTWVLNITHPIDDENRWKYIEEEAVIAVPTFMGKKQLFRIDRVSTVTEGDDTITAVAYPISGILQMTCSYSIADRRKRTVRKH